MRTWLGFLVLLGCVVHPASAAPGDSYLDISKVNNPHDLSEQLRVALIYGTSGPALDAFLTAAAGKGIPLTKEIPFGFFNRVYGEWREREDHAASLRIFHQHGFEAHNSALYYYIRYVDGDGYTHKGKYAPDPRFVQVLCDLYPQTINAATTPDMQRPRPETVLQYIFSRGSVIPAADSSMQKDWLGSVRIILLAGGSMALVPEGSRWSPSDFLQQICGRSPELAAMTAATLETVKDPARYFAALYAENMFPTIVAQLAEGHLNILSILRNPEAHEAILQQAGRDGAFAAQVRELLGRSITERRTAIVTLSEELDLCVAALSHCPRHAR